MDPNAGKYHRQFASEFKAVAKALDGRGGTLEWSQHDYQAFTYSEPGVSLVFYPHRGPSSRMQWIRVRNSNSKAQAAMSEVLELIYSRTRIRKRGYN
ncbi:hypothetical protein [Pseudomonas solani]|uniref:hypothetical protein n=1 Tax=Pseudomonas solani TaxID=2731552 RepID=UPI003D6AB431